ncbi:MAG: cation transporter [Chromatiaceae bacterium]|nr:cation transporter [Gammaproteobacteria bacterium]MCP5409888.1 cation transporter [Chromatiaceae bacterium]
MSGCGCEIEIKDKSETRVLVILLLINGLMFLVEFGVGWWAESTALIADAMDMLADAMVYGVGLYAVGKAVLAKIQAATLSGWLQIGLGLLVLADIVRRFVYGSEPVSTLMMVMGLIALIANTICLILISKHRDGEVHMRASWIFSKNDVIANVGVILAGVLVAATASRIPDLVIGIIVAAIVIRGGIIILKDATKEKVTLIRCSSS